MARTRIFIVLVLALTLGGAFAYGTYQYIDNIPAPAAGLETRPVDIARTSLDVGAELGPEDLRLIEWPASALPEASARRRPSAVSVTPRAWRWNSTIPSRDLSLRT